MAFLNSTEKLQIASDSQSLIYFSVGLVIQTFFFGLYSVLIFLSTRMLLQRKLNTRVNQVMFGITTFMYLLSAAYWGYNVADEFDRIYQFINLALHPSEIIPDHTAVTQWSPLWNAVTLLNYCLSDGVVVWRAWIICLRNHRKYLWITIVFLGITTLTVIATIAFRIAGLVESPIANLASGDFVGEAINILQVTTLVTSLLSNLTATGVVGATALQHWRTIRGALNGEKKSTRSNDILLLVVESGVIYCFSAVLVLLSAIIRLPHGTLGDIYTPINVQIAGAYPTVVLLLVSTKRSLNDSTFSDDTYVGSSVSHPAKSGPPGLNSVSTTSNQSMRFAANPNVTLGTDSVLDITSYREKSRMNLNRLSDDSFA
ncbi:hypothetical protein DFH07DRAFT_833646 [Mycena maculata]|uniref:Uncharacterized protein n=1 Tax=Mycena maculata TaxID=230809 RepID=A0AAD7IM98_9AGAR|nr:hypothetical protein DFH07DRAFT_833646 [Mycena maculata]